MTTESEGGRLPRYIVLGGSGFLGSHIVEALLARGEKEVVVFDKMKPLEGDEFEGVTYIEGDIMDEESLADVFWEVRSFPVYLEDSLFKRIARIT